LELWIKARQFCIDAHEGQKRKYTGEPYYTHPSSVQEIVSKAFIKQPSFREARISPFFSKSLLGYTYINSLCSAYLHDVVEDCNITFNELSREFNKDIAEIVFWCTNLSELKFKNRWDKKITERWKWHAHESINFNAAKIVKAADIIHNCESIFKHDPAFAQVYLKEKHAVLAAMDMYYSAEYRFSQVVLYRAFQYLLNIATYICERGFRKQK
jgi:(p)ppGpp synthase/HD superfamily hydrolase